jgi:hypothetical protein
MSPFVPLKRLPTPFVRPLQEVQYERCSFDIDMKHCPNCGGALKIIAAIEDPPVIIKILSHLGLPTRAPPRAPARRVDLFQSI